MTEWPPEYVETPLGRQPYDQAVRWHLPTILRWIDHNREEPRVPSGELTGSVLRVAATVLENFIKQRERV